MNIVQNLNLALALALILVGSSATNISFAQVPQRFTTELTIDDIDLKDSRDVFQDFEEDFFFEGETIEIEGELRATVTVKEIGKEDVNLSERGVSGATVKIVSMNKFGEIITLAEAVTDSGGNFEAEWKVQILGVDRVVDIIAVYEGNNQFQPAKSQTKRLIVRAAPLEVLGQRGEISVGVSWDPVVIRTGHLSRIDLEFHKPGTTSAIDEVWYDFIVYQDARRIRDEMNVFALDGNWTHFFTTRSNNEISIAIYLRGFGDDDFKAVNDLVEFSISPLGKREVGVVMNVDKPQYLFEEEITLNGRIVSFEPVPVIVHVTNPNGKTCFTRILPALHVDIEGNFETKFRLSEKRCQEPGRYTLTVFYAEQKAETGFFINKPDASLDVIKRGLFTMLRVNNAPFADSTFELRLVFPDGKVVKPFRTPPRWSSYIDYERSTLIFFTDYDPIQASTAKIFKIENPSESVSVEWFTVNNLGKTTATGIVRLD